eukprot:GHRR01034560.1.p1 GENE.GHRR01034560.1~~GHRR01034560.1.p1  ORF type:complete len:135 (+),score=22.25 GHRR01034560.1:258-662(+)
MQFGVRRPETGCSGQLVGRVLPVSHRPQFAQQMTVVFLYSKRFCCCVWCALQVRVQCPEVEGSDKLVGQMLEVEVASLRDTVGHLKSRLEGVTGLTANKMKLNREGVGFLRDELTLAHYNISPDVILVLGTKKK